MEGALEHQAQLIAEFCDLGNYSDDEREEVKSLSLYCHQSYGSSQDLQSEIKLTPKCNGFSKFHVLVGFLETASRSDEKVHFQVREGSTLLSFHDPEEQKSTSLVSDGPGKQEDPQTNLAPGSETSGKQFKPYALVLHLKSDRVSCLLYTPHHSKPLLHKEITCVPSTGSGHAALDPSFRDHGPPPLGSGSGMGSRSSLTGYFPENGALLTSDDLFASDLYTETRRTSFTRLRNQFMNSASRTIPPFPGLDPHLNPVVPAASTSLHLQCSYNPNLVMRQPSNGDISGDWIRTWNLHSHLRILSFSTVI